MRRSASLVEAEEASSFGRSTEACARALSPACAITSVVMPSARSRSMCHVPAIVPSWSTVPWMMGAVHGCPCRSARTKRERSACDSSTLSYSGRNRGGAGVSGSGRGASGQIEQLTASLVEEDAESRPQPLDHLAHPGQARPRRHVGNGRRPERAAGSGRPPRRSRARRISSRPSHASAVVEATCASSAPHTSRWHLDERQQVPARVGERWSVEIGEAGRELVAELGPRSWLARRETSWHGREPA